MERKRERYRFYKNQGFTEPLIHMFCNMEEKQEEKVIEEPTDEMKQYILQKSLDLHTKEQQLLKLDNIIQKNHKKLNKYFHEDYPNGWAFPDEVYDYIKSFNPKPPKKLKCLYFTDCDGIKNKVRIIKKHYFINRSDRAGRYNYGSWFFSKRHSHIEMKKIKDFDGCLNNAFSFTKSMRDKLKKDNDCDWRTLKNYVGKYENDYRWTNIVNWRNNVVYGDFFFIHLSYSGKNKLCFNIYCINNNDEITHTSTFNKKINDDNVYKLNYKQRTETGLYNYTCGKQIIITDDLIPMSSYLESIKERPNDKIKELYSKIKKLQKHKKYYIENTLK